MAVCYDDTEDNAFKRVNICRWFNEYKKILKVR